MKSDIYTTRVDLQPGFEQVIKNLCKLQADRDNPRKLVSTFIYDEKLVLIFELV